MIRFDPESPWHVGQRILLYDGEIVEVKVVESVEHSISKDHSLIETQYSLVSEKAWELRQSGVRPWAELG